MERDEINREDFLEKVTDSLEEIGEDMAERLLRSNHSYLISMLKLDLE